MLIKSEQLSVGSLIKNVMLKYLFWASYILRLCAQTCTPNRHAKVTTWWIYPRAGGSKRKWILVWGGNRKAAFL